MCFERMFGNRNGRSALHILAWSSSSMSVPVTRFSMRLYGSKKAVEQEQKRHENISKWVLHPYSNVRFLWDCISLLLLIVSMLVIPVAITFFNDEMTTVWPWIVFNLTLDCWFLADILLNFHTGIIMDSGEGDVILNLVTIRSRYFKTWFLIDLISTLPLDYILQMTTGGSASGNASRAVKLFRFVKLISLLRLLRISRLIRYVHQWEQIVGMQYDLAVAAVRIFNLVCLMLLIGHWNGCLQFLIPMLYGFPHDSWIVIDDLVHKHWGEQYSWCVFKAMSHMLCIGYGQEPPKNMMDLWMTMLSMVSGAVCFAMFIGHATALIQSMDSSKRQYKEKYMQVKEYMRYRRLPKTLRNRVHKYYETRYQGKMFDEEGILAELSKGLREEVVNYNCRHLVASVPYFIEADQEFVTGIVQKLKFEVFLPEDVIVKEGMYGKKMYFIQHGIVEVRKSDVKERIAQLSDGSYFGEICLLVHERRVASVISSSYCHIYSLHVDDFNNILEEFPVMRITLEKVAANRLKEIGKDNEALNNKLKSFDDNSSEAKSLAARIVQHDKTCDTPNIAGSRWHHNHRAPLKENEKVPKRRKSHISESDVMQSQNQMTTYATDDQAVKSNELDDASSCLSINEATLTPQQTSLSKATVKTRAHDARKRFTRRLSKPKLPRFGLAKKISKRRSADDLEFMSRRVERPRGSQSSSDDPSLNMFVENCQGTFDSSEIQNVEKNSYILVDIGDCCDTLKQDIPFSNNKNDNESQDADTLEKQINDIGKSTNCYEEQEINSNVEKLETSTHTPTEENVPKSDDTNTTSFSKLEFDLEVETNNLA